MDATAGQVTQLPGGGGMRESPEGGHLEFPCNGCGATLSFAPGAQALACAHCGHKEEIPQSKEGVVEHSFEDYKRAKEKGWGTETKTYDCRGCGAKTTVEASAASFTCPFCASPQVDPTPDQDRLRPESVLPFAVAKNQILERFKAWVSGLWFRPNALKKLATLDAIRGVYIPHWTYDSATHSFWDAQAGYHYYVDETYRDAQGKTQTRRVQKTRWERVSGTHDAFFDDVLVHASRGVKVGLMSEIYPFDTKTLATYDPRYLAGWAAEDYQREMPDCWPEAKRYMDSRIESAITSKIPGDTHRDLSVRTSFFNRTWKLCLLPVFVASYRYGGKVWPCLVNGQTGEVAGEAPVSWAKVGGLVAAILAVLVVILKLASG